MATFDDLKDRIIQRLEKTIVTSTGVSDLTSVFGEASAPERAEFVTSLQAGDQNRLGRLWRIWYRRWIAAEALVRFNSLKAQGNLSPDDLEDLL